MAFIVEDGTGVKGATSLATLDGFRDYFLDRNIDVASVTDPAVQGALIAATDYIGTRWGTRFLGSRFFATLSSRSVLTMTAVPLDSETVTLGIQVYTFKTTPSAANDVAIGLSALQSMNNLLGTISNSSNEFFAGAQFVDPDEAVVTILTSDNGVATTATLSNGSFDVAVSAGKSLSPQLLDFPRSGLFDNDGDAVVGVPLKAQQATYEYANRAITSTLGPDPVIPETGTRLTLDRKKVDDAVETEKRYAEETSIIITRPYPAADNLLKEYVFPSGTAVRA